MNTVKFTLLIFLEIEECKNNYNFKTSGQLFLFLFSREQGLK